MPQSNEGSLVGFDAGAATAAAREAGDGGVLVSVEFTEDEFGVRYVADEVADLYPDEERMLAHFDRIHSYVYLDVMESDLFTGELFPVASEVRSFTTTMDALTLVRVYHEREGLFFTLSPDQPASPIVEAVEDVLGR